MNDGLMDKMTGLLGAASRYLVREEARRVAEQACVAGTSIYTWWLIFYLANNDVAVLLPG